MTHQFRVLEPVTQAVGVSRCRQGEDSWADLVRCAIEEKLTCSLQNQIDFLGVGVAVFTADTPCGRAAHSTTSVADSSSRLV